MGKCFLHVALVLSLVTIFSCRKEVSTENPNGRDGSFTASVDGSQWIAAMDRKSAYIVGGAINITGISADNKQVSISLNDTIAGTYTLDQSTTSLAAYQNIDSADLYAYTTSQGLDTADAGGSVTVTQIDPINHTITGTFAFNVYRDVDGKQRRLTEGVFYKLPYSNELPAAASGDTMTATIDGQKWVAKTIIGSAISTTLIVNGSTLSGAQALSVFMPVGTPEGGPFLLDYTGSDYMGVYSPVINSTFVSSSGNMTVLEYNTTTKRVRGNFQFEAMDPTFSTPDLHQVKDGYFSVVYQ